MNNPPSEIRKEICLNCKHTKRWHNKGSCIQPTCMCNCFIESGLNYTTDVLDTFQQGQLAEQERSKKLCDKCKPYQEGIKHERERCLKMMKELEKQLIRRICSLNKSVNTFENAREQEEIIKEEFEELTQKIKEMEK